MFEHRAFWLPKNVDRADEYQDAYGVRVNELLGEAVAVVADGVSSSLFSGRWARILTDAVLQDPPQVHDPVSLPEWLSEHRRRWLEPIDEETLAWHQKPKFQHGAHTTLLWVEICNADPDEAGTTEAMKYYACAVGDSCLFHVREDRVLRQFPAIASADFLKDPVVLCSFEKKNVPEPPFERCDNFCQPGDFLVLCTDAVAAWAAALIEDGAGPKWRKYWNMSEEDWREEVLALRETQHMRADDATLLLLRMGDG